MFSFNRIYFVKETDVFDIVDGKVFDLDDTRDRFIWEAIKYCPLIAQDYYAKDKNGNSLINGTPGDYTLKDYLSTVYLTLSTIQLPYVSAKSHL